MDIIILLAGFVVMCLGLAYLYWPSLILKINGWVRRVLLNDLSLIENRKKIGLLLILVAALVISYGSSLSRRLGFSIRQSGIIKSEVAHLRLYNAYHSYYSGNTAKAESLCNDILGIQPNNLQAIKLLGFIYAAKGEYIKAIPPLKKALEANPGDTKVKQKLEELQNMKAIK